MDLNSLFFLFYLQQQRIKYLPLIFNLIQTDIACLQYCNYCTYLFSSYLAFNIWPWRKMFYQRFAGNWCTIAFRVDTKAYFSPLRQRLEIAFLVQEWGSSHWNGQVEGRSDIARGPQYMPVILGDEISTLDVQFICLFISRFIYMIKIPTRVNHLVKRQERDHLTPSNILDPCFSPQTTRFCKRQFPIRKCESSQ